MTAQEFKDWRASLGLTQAAAGDHLGMTKRQIQKYEAGDVEIPRAVELATCELSRRLESDE